MDTLLPIVPLMHAIVFIREGPAMTCITPDSRFISLGAVLVCLAIGLGAWAAHGLEKTIASRYEEEAKLVAVLNFHIPTVTKYVGNFKTAADYQLGQGLGLILIGLLYRQNPSRVLRVAGVCLCVGTALFSGSLYVLVLTGVTKWGAVTPIGGLLLMVGWALVAYGACPCRK